MSLKFRSFAVLLCLGSLLFAQGAPKKVLTPKDVDAFIANYPAMQKEFDALGDKYNDLLGDGEDGGSYAAVLAQARSAEVPAEIKAILKKYGFGENGFEKLIVITLGCSALEMDRVLSEQAADPDMTADMLSYMDGAKAQVAQMKEAVHKDDLAVIKPKQAKIVEMLGIEEE
jgi:hypothetical protein